MDAGDAATGSTASVALTGLTVIGVVKQPDGTAGRYLIDGDRVKFVSLHAAAATLYFSDQMEKQTHGYSASLSG